MAPKYLKDLIVRVSPPARNLHSSIDVNRLTVLRTKLKTFASTAFSVLGPSEWNSLPIRIRDITSYERFKKELKTFLFKKYYGC